MAIRLLYVVDHPIQYQAPLLRLIAQQPDIELRVIFQNAAGSAEYFDPGFGKRIRWDVSLLDGYDSETLPDDRDAIERLTDCDVAWLHGWQGKRMRRLLAQAKRLDVPVLMRGENTDAAMPDGTGLRGSIKRTYLDWIFSRCAAFLCIGSANRAYYLRRGIDPSRLFSVPYAVDNAFFQSFDDKHVAEIRTELRLDKGRPVILFAGKLQTRKHPQALVDAFRHLDRERLRQPYLLFVGDGEERPRIEAAAASNPDIRYPGFKNQTELPALYNLADVFVLASSREPWGLAVNEAMNCQCAVVVSDECGCAADLVTDACGRIVPAGQATPLARALDEILVDPDNLLRMKRAAADRVKVWDFEADLVGLRAALGSVCPEPRTA